MEVYTEIQIDSTPDLVWKILTNFSDYSSWNPFLTQVTGEVKKGATIHICVEPPGLKSMNFTPIVTKVEANRELRWEGKFIIPNFFDGEHIFILEELDGRSVRFIHKEIYTGLLVPLMQKQLNKNTKQGFELMNQALKEKAESQQRSLSKNPVSMRGLNV
jgi:hypothetical protein